VKFLIKILDKYPIIKLWGVLFFIIYNFFASAYIIKYGVNEKNVIITIVFIVLFSIFSTLFIWGIKLLTEEVSKIKLPDFFKKYIDNENN